MRVLFAAACLALVACTDVELTPRWRVDRFRVLGVIAEPPDALAGESVALAALTADRPGPARPVAVAWTLCARMTIDNNTGDRACSKNAAPVLGDPARFTLPEAAADGSPWAFFGLACAGGTPSVDPATMQPRCDGGVGEAFLRTVRIRRGAGNRNPLIARVRVDGVEATDASPARVAPCALTDPDARDAQRPAHALSVEFADDAREPISVVQPDGSALVQPESLVTEFLVDGGDLATVFRSDNDAVGGAHANTFRAPATGPVRLWVLARDGRGGFDAATRTIVVGP